MSVLAWNSTLAVGYTPIDDQHEKLVDILNKLGEAMKVGKGREVMGAVLSDLTDYTVYHFTFEEKLMDAHAIPHSAQHKELHGEFTAKLKALTADLEAGSLAVAVEVMAFLGDWLRDHFMKIDKELADQLKEKGV